MQHGLCKYTDDGRCCTVYFEKVLRRILSISHLFYEDHIHAYKCIRVIIINIIFKVLFNFLKYVTSEKYM